MQKIIKRLIAVLLVIAMAASCSSCKIIDTLLFDENPKEPVGGIHFANPDFVEAEDDGSDGDSDPFVGQVSPSSENEENSRFKKVTDYAVLINKWDCYYALGNCCDSKYTDENLGGYNEDYYGYGNYRISCCANFAEVKQHAYHYMDESLFEAWDGVQYFKYKGNFYFSVPAYGPPLHDVNKIEILDDSDPSEVTIKAFIYEAGEKIGYTVFTVDTTGSYKIIDVENTYY